MTGTDESFGDRQAARRQLVTMAGLLVLVLVVIGFMALYGLDRIRSRAEAHAAATDRLIAATDLSREAEVAFKTQVQEWKNVLLRGHNPQDLESYWASFQEYQATVADRLGQVREHAAGLGMTTDAIDRVLTMHGELAERYAEAKSGFDPGTPESAWRVDRSVRGIDRPLTDAFGALVEEVRASAAARTEAVRMAMAEETARQRKVLIGAHAAGLALVLVSLLLALRALRRR